MKRGRRKGSKDGAGATQPLPFSIVYQPSSGGALMVTIGQRPYPAYADEVWIGGLCVTAAPAGGIRIDGEGVVRKAGRTIRVTA